MLGDAAWHGPLVLAFWVRRGSILTHYEKNCGVSELTGAIFLAQFLKNSIFWEISQKSTYSKHHSCEGRGVPATRWPVPVYHWMCVVRCAAGFYPRRLHGGIRGHYPGIQNFSKIMNFEKFEFARKWNLRKSKIFPMNITSKCIRTQILSLWGWVYPLQIL